MASMLFSPVIGATVNADAITVLDDKLDGLDALLATELRGSVVNVRPVEPGHYR